MPSSPWPPIRPNTPKSSSKSPPRAHHAGAAPPVGPGGYRPHGPIRSGRSAQYLAEQIKPEDFPHRWHVHLRRKEVLRYGENPHQQAALYAAGGCLRRGQPGGGPAVGRQGTVLQQPARSGQRAGHRPVARGAGRGGDQAQQSLRCRCGGTALRGHAGGTRWRRIERVRLGAGLQPPARRRLGRSAGRAGPFCRSDRRPRLRARRHSKSSRRSPSGRPTCG